jgi:hypothetical protein
MVESTLGQIGNKPNGDVYCCGTCLTDELGGIKLRDKHHIYMPGTGLQSSCLPSCETGATVAYRFVAVLIGLICPCSPSD